MPENFLEVAAVMLPPNIMQAISIGKRRENSIRAQMGTMKAFL
jgi:hypothetical protein